jgi:hypothetical protein
MYTFGVEAMGVRGLWSHPTEGATGSGETMVSGCQPSFWHLLSVTPGALDLLRHLAVSQCFTS